MVDVGRALDPDNDGLFQPGLGAGLFESLAVRDTVAEDQRVDRGEGLVGLAERPLVQQEIEPAPRRERTVVATGGTNAQPFPRR